MNYFSTLEQVLLANNPKDKIEKFKSFYKNFINNNFTFEKDYIPYELKEPSYISFLKIVKPTSLPKIKNFKSIEGKQYLLHTILHIEYSAIDLALDAALRYKDLPLEYYKDWLEVADDEIRHFLMLEELLAEIGGKYGDFAVHKNLFEAMETTPEFLRRMAAVPRYLEANGLDQNPKIMEKLKSNNDPFNRKILDVLNIILEEEVDHVTKGDVWFKYACDLENVPYDSTYLQIIEEVFPGSTKRKMDLNFEARKKAGFSCELLKTLSKKEDCN
ncbi:ferritin-like domain-containing protein [Arcobacter roscoffensis]|uniref:Ferritin-like domain-containing protein n=1 Tax=Arcobacter roscoffensis TaxID=2961520 RepID=A0ABY5E0K2_9BACT|nr:ferritin-like domain-containing protein [Arcobacter roscoffensis]UTJ05079.1 ferritin-like domain-containing protein [Arcobacter roscoffensis]